MILPFSTDCLKARLFLLEYSLQNKKNLKKGYVFKLYEIWYDSAKKEDNALPLNYTD